MWRSYAGTFQPKPPVPAAAAGEFAKPNNKKKKKPRIKPQTSINNNNKSPHKKAIIYRQQSVEVSSSLSGMDGGTTRSGGGSGSTGTIAAIDDDLSAVVSAVGITQPSVAQSTRDRVGLLRRSNLFSSNRRSTTGGGTGNSSPGSYSNSNNNGNGNGGSGGSSTESLPTATALGGSAKGSKALEPRRSSSGSSLRQNQTLPEESLPTGTGGVTSCEGTGGTSSSSPKQPRSPSALNQKSNSVSSLPISGGSSGKVQMTEAELNDFMERMSAGAKHRDSSPHIFSSQQQQQPNGVGNHTGGDNHNSGTLINGAIGGQTAPFTGLGLEPLLSDNRSAPELPTTKGIDYPRAASWSSSTVAEILRDPLGRQMFRCFLHEALAEENLLFVEELDMLRKERDESTVREGIAGILKKYCQIINLSSVSMNALKEVIKEDNDAPVDKKALDNAYKEIYKFLENDQFPRFRRSKIYLSYLEKLLPRAYAERWMSSFDALLGNQVGRHHFREFLMSVHAEENLRFWESVVEYRSTRNKSTAMQNLGKQIQQQFLREGAPNEVFLPFGLRQRIEKKLRDKDGVDETLFDDAVKHVEQILKNDPYVRFLQSKEYTELLKRLRE